MTSWVGIKILWKGIPLRLSSSVGGVMTQSAFSVPLPLLALSLGWFAGVFLYLGASSLLPAAHESSHSRWLPVATLAGVAFIYLAQQLAE